MKFNRGIKVLALAAVGVAFTLTAAAQSTTTTDPTVAQRKENQQDRIAQGVKSGQLTPGETAKLEKQQQGINREEAGMREANGGKLTGADKKALNQQQNRASRLQQEAQRPQAVSSLCREKAKKPRLHVGAFHFSKRSSDCPQPLRFYSRRSQN
jgi:hypothetical protein